MHRRRFLSTPLAAAAMTASSAPAQNAPRYDTVLKGGRVIDLANRINQPMDVAVLNGKIARVDRDIPAAEGKKTVDVSGFYVTPGLIDMHICCYYTRLDLTASVIADHHCLPSGVTTCCDGGTAGGRELRGLQEDHRPLENENPLLSQHRGPGGAIGWSGAGSGSVQSAACGGYRQEVPQADRRLQNRPLWGQVQRCPPSLGVHGRRGRGRPPGRGARAGGLHSAAGPGKISRQ